MTDLVFGEKKVFTGFSGKKKKCLNKVKTKEQKLDVGDMTDEGA